MKAKERHHLKQDEFTVRAIRVATNLAEQRTRVTIALVVVLVIVSMIGGGLWWRNRTADQAGALLGVAMAIGNAQIAPASTLPGAEKLTTTFPTIAARSQATIDALGEVIAQYPSTDAGRIALYHRGTEYLDARRFTEAEQDFRKVMADEGSSIQAATARLGLAQALLGAGKTDEGLKVLTDLSAERAGALPVDSVLMQLARASLKVGKTAEARAAFKRIVDEFPESPYVEDAKQRLAELS